MRGAVKLALADVLAIYLTYNSVGAAAYSADNGHWGRFVLALIASGFFAVCMCFLAWRFAKRFANLA